MKKILQECPRRSSPPVVEIHPDRSRRSLRSLSNDRPPTIDRWIRNRSSNDRRDEDVPTLTATARYIVSPPPLLSRLRYLSRCLFLLCSFGQQGTKGGRDFNDDAQRRRHLPREPRDVTGSLEAALTFELRLEFVHLRFYRVLQF